MDVEQLIHNLDKRVTTLEAIIPELKDDIKELKGDIKWIRQTMAEKDDLDRISTKVNGLSTQVAENRGRLSIILSWLAQGGVIGGSFVLVFKVAQALGLL